MISFSFKSLIQLELTMSSWNMLKNSFNNFPLTNSSKKKKLFFTNLKRSISCFYLAKQHWTMTHKMIIFFFWNKKKDKKEFGSLMRESIGKVYKKILFNDFFLFNEAWKRGWFTFRSLNISTKLFSLSFKNIL
jgi:hypothetical protein